MEFLSRLVDRWPVALACVAVLGAATLLPGLGSFGLWEPQERQLADRVAPRPQLAPKPSPAPAKPGPAPAKTSCNRMPPDDAVARTLSNRAMQAGRDYLADSDAGRRLPFAILGLLTVLATAGIAMRLAGSRAGVVTTLVLLSMPLLVLQSRQLTSEIGTAAGGALTVYGLVALGSLGQHRRMIVASMDALVGVLALAAGIAIGFVAGGALLGVLVPVGGFAVAGMLGIPTAIDVARATYNGALWTARRFAPRLATGRAPLRYQSPGNWPALLAMLLSIGVVVALAYQLYSLDRPQLGMNPPQRGLFDKALVSTGCWSSALGAVWRSDDDLRYVFDSTFEQIAYGTFPWGILGVIAIAALISAPRAASESVLPQALGPRPDTRQGTGALTLAWASAAWIACEAFQRKVSFTLWPGFPALAIAIGVWLDGVLAGRARGDRAAIPNGARLVGLCVGLGMLVLAKDMLSFAERISSLLVGGDQIAYPLASKLLWIKTKLWIVVLGAIVGIGFAVAMIAWRDDATGSPRLRTTSQVGMLAAAVGTVLLVAFWPFVWQPKLAQHLSSKTMFDTYLELRKPGDQLVIMGDMGGAAHEYAPDDKPETMPGREQLVQAIGRPNRVFAIAPQTELCQLHREIGGKPYFVVEDRNTRSLLLSNRSDGTTDKNPLRTQILHAEPAQIATRPKARVVWDGRIELLGWSIPKRVDRGSKFEVKLFLKVLQAPSGNWRVLFHVDGPIRINGDHEPINGRCQTSTWQPGDFIVDTFTVTAGGSAHARGSYEVWTGFFTGSNPNWTNMKISEAPADQRDSADRVKITTITLD